MMRLLIFQRLDIPVFRFQIVVNDDIPNTRLLLGKRIDQRIANIASTTGNQNVHLDFAKSLCSPHSVFAMPLQRPERSTPSDDGAAVHGLHPTEM